MALGYLALLSTLASSGGLGLMASARGRGLAAALALGWVAGSGFLAGLLWLLALSAGDFYRFLRAGAGFFELV